MSLYITPRTFQNDDSGRSTPLASLGFYDTNTFDFKNTYSNSAKTIVNPNPVIADGAGRFPKIYIDSDTPYRVVFSERVAPNQYETIWTEDDVTTGAGATLSTYYQPTEPTLANAGDLWYDTSIGKSFRYDGVIWESTEDSGIDEALADAATAQSTADGKIVTFFQAFAPVAEGEGDLWFDTSDGNSQYRWNGSSWVSSADADIATAIDDAANAQATADGKVLTFYQASPPTADGVGDLWIDTGDGNKLYRWGGSSWDDSQDADINTALSDAANAQSTADGKIVSFYQTSAPTAEGEGDLWFDTDDENKPYRWDGASWIATPQDTADWAKVFGANQPADNADVTETTIESGVALASGYLRDTGDNIDIDFANQRIQIGSSASTNTVTDPGVQLGRYGGTYELYAGDGANKSFHFDGTNVIMGGETVINGVKGYNTTDSLFFTQTPAQTPIVTNGTISTIQTANYIRFQDSNAIGDAITTSQGVYGGGLALGDPFTIGNPFRAKTRVRVRIQSGSFSSNVSYVTAAFGLTGIGPSDTSSSLDAIGVQFRWSSGSSSRVRPFVQSAGVFTYGAADVLVPSGSEITYTLEVIKTAAASTQIILTRLDGTPVIDEVMTATTSNTGDRYYTFSMDVNDTLSATPATYAYMGEVMIDQQA